MNKIVGFGLCTLSDQELLAKVDAGTDKMYQTGKIPDRQIPARPNDDYDLLVGELVRRYNERLKPTTIPSYSVEEVKEQLSEAMAECERLAEIASHWQNKYYELNPPHQPKKLDNL